MKFDYILRETAINLRRNVTLTLAAILTVAVSLSLFGSTLLIRQAVDNVTARWEDGIQLIVFLERDASDEQRQALEAKFDENPEISEARFVDVRESREEALRLFERNEAMKKKVTESEDLVPPSYRLVPTTKDDSVIRSLTAQYESEAGVRSATNQLESVRVVRGVSDFLQRAMLAIAVGLLIAALMLILNAIRMAMFARRREIEVMKLVGATNWFIRIPFMLEGIIQGFVGSLFAVVSVWLLDGFMDSAAKNREYHALLENFVAAPGERLLTIGVVVFLGIVIGAAGSGWGLSRFLKV
jgi:cell division transport system permease protein